jgi:hypothetical protein
LLDRSAQRCVAPPHSAAGSGAFIVSGVVPGFPAQQCGLIQRDDVLCKVDRYTLNSSLKVQDVNTLIRCVSVCACVRRMQATANVGMLAATHASMHVRCTLTLRACLALRGVWSRGAAGTSVELVFRDIAGIEKTVKLQRVEVSASGNVQPVEPPQAKQTPSRAHSLADLCTPQRVYAADASPADLRAPARQRKGVVTSEKTRTVAVGKSIVSDLRAALTLMRCIADGHAQMASKGAQNDKKNLTGIAVSTAVRIAEEATEAAESAHLAAAWLQQEIRRLHYAADMEKGRAHAAVERASDAEARSAHYCDLLAKKENEISKLQKMLETGADTSMGGKNKAIGAGQRANAGPETMGSSRSLMRQGAMGSSRSIVSNPLDSLQTNNGGGTAVDEIARGITGAFALFNPFGTVMSVQPVALSAVSGRGAPQDFDSVPITGRSGPNLPFMLQRTVNDSPFVQGKHRILNDQAPRTDFGSPVADGRQLPNQLCTVACTCVDKMRI